MQVIFNYSTLLSSQTAASLLYNTDNLELPRQPTDTDCVTKNPKQADFSDRHMAARHNKD